MQSLFEPYNFPLIMYFYDILNIPKYIFEITLDVYDNIYDAFCN
jgi:hypothetical protein